MSKHLLKVRLSLFLAALGGIIPSQIAEAQPYYSTQVLTPWTTVQIVSYRDTNNYYQYFPLTDHTVGRDDKQLGLPGEGQPYYDLYRTCYSFNLGHSGIPVDSIVSVSVKLSISNAFNNYDSVIVDSVSPSESFNFNYSGNFTDIGKGRTYFKVPYSAQWDSSSSAELTNALVSSYKSSGYFNIGVRSSVENQNYTYADIGYISVTVKYKVPPTIVTIRNSFSGGSVKVDGAQYNNIGTGAAFRWQSGINHTITALDSQNILDSNGKYYVRIYQDWHDSLSGNEVAARPQFSYTFNVTTNDAYTANFKKLFDVTFSPPTYVEAGGSGAYYEMNGVQTSSGTVLQGNSSTIQAVAASGWGFVSWSDGNTSNPRTLTPTDNITLSALFKTHLRSSVNTATGDNAQRKIVRGSSGTYHLVYESAGDIWYTSSTDGTNWGDERLVSDGSGDNHSPSIAVDRHDDVIIVYQKGNSSDGVKDAMLRVKDSSGVWNSPFRIDEIATFPAPPDMTPVVAAAYSNKANNNSGGDFYVCVWDDAGLQLKIFNVATATWGNTISLSTSSNAVAPSLTRDYANNLSALFYLAYKDGDAVYYKSISVQGENSPVLGTAENVSSGDGMTDHQHPVITADGVSGSGSVISVAYDVYDGEPLELRDAVVRQRGSGGWGSFTYFEATDP